MKCIRPGLLLAVLLPLPAFGVDEVAEVQEPSTYAEIRVLDTETGAACRWWSWKQSTA